MQWAKAPRAPFVFTTNDVKQVKLLYYGLLISNVGQGEGSAGKRTLLLSPTAQAAGGRAYSVQPGSEPRVYLHMHNTKKKTVKLMQYLCVSTL